MIPNRIGSSGEDNGHSGGRSCGGNRSEAVCDDHGHGPVDQFGYQRGQPISVAFRRAQLNNYVLILGKSRFLQARPKRCNEVHGIAKRFATEKADYRQSRLLRARTERPHNSRPDHYYKMPPSHELSPKPESGHPTTLNSRCCAPQQTRPRDFRLGSKADVTLLNFDVRFTPESGHATAVAECLVWAISRQSAPQQSGSYSITSSLVPSICILRRATSASAQKVDLG
jgi:hypothetical protein